VRGCEGLRRLSRRIEVQRDPKMCGGGDARPKAAEYAGRKPRAIVHKNGLQNRRVIEGVEIYSARTDKWGDDERGHADAQVLGSLWMQRGDDESRIAFGGAGWRNVIVKSAVLIVGNDQQTLTKPA